VEKLRRQLTPHHKGVRLSRKALAFLKISRGEAGERK
jgi:hypothetical protein